MIVEDVPSEDPESPVAAVTSMPLAAAAFNNSFVALRSAAPIHLSGAPHEQEMIDGV